MTDYLRLLTILLSAIDMFLERKIGFSELKKITEEIKDKIRA